MMQMKRKRVIVAEKCSLDAGWYFSSQFVIDFLLWVKSFIILPPLNYVSICNLELDSDCLCWFVCKSNSFIRLSSDFMIRTSYGIGLHIHALCDHKTAIVRHQTVVNLNLNESNLTRTVKRFRADNLCATQFSIFLQQSTPFINEETRVKLWSGYDNSCGRNQDSFSGSQHTFTMFINNKLRINWHQLGL